MSSSDTWAIVCPHELGLHVLANVGIVLTEAMVLVRRRDREVALEEWTGWMRRSVDSAEAPSGWYLAQLRPLKTRPAIWGGDPWASGTAWAVLSLEAL